MTVYACGLDPRTKYNALSDSAFNRNKEFTIGVDNLETLFSRNNGKCIYSGIKFINEINHEDAPSIDRIAPNAGYVPGNIVLCTRRFNNLKQKYFETPSTEVLYVTAKEIDEAFLIYKKLIKAEEMMQLSMLGTDEAPKLRTNNMINRFLDRISVSITMGVKVPDELRKALKNRKVDDYDPQEDAQCFGDVSKVATIGNSLKMSAIERYGNISRFPRTSSTTSTVPEQKKVIPVQKSNQHSDYEISKQYIQYCDKHKPNLSFAEFSAKVTQPVCDFSLEVLTERELFVIDSSKEITSDNLLVVDKKYIKVLQAMKDSSIGFDQFSKYLNNICKVIYKD